MLLIDLCVRFNAAYILFLMLGIHFTNERYKMFKVKEAEVKKKYLHIDFLPFLPILLAKSFWLFYISSCAVY